MFRDKPTRGHLRAQRGWGFAFFFILLAFGAASMRADSPVVFNEIMYHPPTNEAQLEWVELQNQLSVDVDVSRWSLDGGITFVFPEGTVIRAGDYLVVSASPAVLMAATGRTNVVGPFLDRLSNSGERIQLRNNSRRLMDEVEYSVEGEWPVAPDGAGPSLARSRANLRTSDPQNWQASLEMGGTPGRENFPASSASAVTNTLALIESAWKYNDSGVDLGTAWRSLGYNDSAWPSGFALFHQEEAPLPAAKNTPLTAGRTTYYFRTTFAVTGEVGLVRLQLRPIVDDGAVGYLNGVEVFRLNMPPGEPGYSTLASSVVTDAGIGDTLFLPGDGLQPGANVLAVEVHQGPRSSAYPEAVLASNPVGYWRLGETSGAALDLASAAAAPQAGAQNGAYSGLSTTNRAQFGPRSSDIANAQFLTGFEANNPAPRFAGNADGGNDVITIPDPGVFNFASTRTFTLEAWVNGSGAQENGGAIIAKGTGGGGEQFALDMQNGLYRFYGWDGGVPNTAVVANSSVGPNGSWQHVVAVLDQPAGRMKIYVNGVETGSAVPRATLLNSTHEVSIGARKNLNSAGYDLNFDGRIDEVAIYNRALSTNEILAHFNAAFSNSAAIGPDTNDVVFGMEIVSVETQLEPERPRVAFNELASATNSAFWFELINHGKTNVDLNGWTLMRFGGLTNREYTFAPTLLAPGQAFPVTRAQLGFGVDPGDRLVLYMPGRTNLADAVVAKRELRGRHPDATGEWWFSSQPTPGGSNSFAFHNELVINEIMYHHPELPAAPAAFSATNTIISITNQWKFHNQGLDLGTDWRLPAYDDSSWPASNALFFAPVSPLVLPAPKNTFLPLTNGAGERIITYYFRTQFPFNGSTNGLRLALHSIIDDGAVFYLNGVEVQRLNMPSTNIQYGTLATVNVSIPAYTGPVIIPTDALVQGLNTLAVEVHQVAPTNGDFDFGAALLAWYETSPALPYRDSPQSWVEIFNRSSNPVDLTGWRLDEGIDFHFPPGKVLAPGGYLVVAKDPAVMQSLYPGVDVLGPFTNKLSKSSDYLVLKDPFNNIADEVRYFGSGHWPGYADGGGSSLELREPRADNTVPQSWAASDESSRSQWETFTWRGVAAPGQGGEPSLWHELDLCLVDGAGEVLLDDISVVETPATAPKELIQNGSFSDATAAHWRFLGNHRRSRVEAEPGNPGNSVLHLVATGPGEYQGNQIETTLTNNVAIVDGREYQVFFRAKWLAGKRKLNSRLYFNRLAHTVDLAAPPQAGTPGAVNSRFVPNIGPTFSELLHAPVIPLPNQAVTVSVNASDPDGIQALTLKYSVSGTPWQSVPMLLQSSDGTSRFNASIPGQPAASVVQFYIEGTDALGLASFYPPTGTNSRALYVVQDGQAAPPPLHNFRVVMTASDAAFLHTSTNTLSNELLGCTVITDENEVFYDCSVRLKGSFVGRNVARVGFHVAFHPDKPFRGLHEVVSVDRSQHTAIGSVGEIVTKHVANRAGGIPNMQDDLARFIAPLASHTSMSQLRFSGFDSDYLDAQWENGSDGPMFEVEVIRWNVATVDGNPESVKQPGNESGGTGYVNLEVQDYGDNKESYRWVFLQANRRSADDYTPAMSLAKTFSLTGAALDAQAAQVLDVEEWLRVMAFQQLVGPADSYFTGANIHNFRIYQRPEDRKVLYMPWDWDSSFLASTSASIFGSGNIAKLLNNANYRRSYLNHLYDIINTSFNTAYMSRWTTHYGSVSGQDMSGILNYINARASFVLGQLPTATVFVITNNNGNNFSVSNSMVTLSGTAPISVRTIEVNGIAYAVTWTNLTNWTLTLPLFAGENNLQVRGLDNAGNLRSNAVDAIIVTNAGPTAIMPVVINEWMADNAGPAGLADPSDSLFQDWFELFNPNTNAVNLSGYYLTDDLFVPTKWRVPTNTVIPARGFLLVWADNQTNQNSGMPGSDLHAAFQLGAGGEAIGFYSPDGFTPQSTVIFGPQTQNVSQGFFPDGQTNSPYAMTNFTPRAANTLAGPLRWVQLSYSGSTLTLTWSAVSGRHYRIEYKDDLSAPAWSEIPGTIQATGSTASVNDSMSAHRFYRVIRLD